MLNSNKLLTIVIPQHSESITTVERLLSSINQQIGIDLKRQVDIKIIGDGGVKLSNKLFDLFPKLDIEYHYYKNAHGPGYARQIGLNLTNSKYISYMDADDQLNTVNALWKFINVIRTTGNHEVIYARYVEEHEQQANGFNTFTVREYNPAAVYAKWISVRYIRHHKFYWHPELPYAYEDTFFMDQVMVFSKDVYYLDSPTYSWLYNPSSIVRSDADYNQVHLNEYFRENRLWALEMIKRAPQRMHFDINNGLVNMYNFMEKHPPINKKKKATMNEFDLYLKQNIKCIDVDYAVQLLNQQNKDEDSIQFKQFILNRLKINNLKTAFYIKPTVPLLDIIVPFNGRGEGRLYQLLTSIQNQQLIDIKQVEVIISVDGYNDDLDDLDVQSFNFKIKVEYSGQRQGPGLTRQIGLNEAGSKYVMFCDADDQLYSVLSLYQMYQIMLEKNNPEIIIGKYLNEQIDKSNDHHYLQEWNYNWGAVYPIWFKLDFLHSYKISFANDLHSYYEDTFFTGIAQRMANKIAYLDKPVYTHNLRINSLIHKNNLKERQENLLIEYCKENRDWFNEARIRFPEMLTTDINQFTLNLYYMYESYNLNNRKVDKIIQSIIQDIVDDNYSFWNGWTNQLQIQADNMNTGDAEGQTSKNLKSFIGKFMLGSD